MASPEKEKEKEKETEGTVGRRGRKRSSSERGAPGSERERRPSLWERIAGVAAARRPSLAFEDAANRALEDQLGTLDEGAAPRTKDGTDQAKLTGMEAAVSVGEGCTGRIPGAETAIQVLMEGHQEELFDNPLFASDEYAAPFRPRGPDPLSRC